MTPKQREEWDTMLLSPLPGPKKKKAKAAVVDDGSGFMDLYRSVKKGGA